MQYRLTAVAVLLVVAAGLSAPNALTQAPAGFVSLFNGRDLSGWTVPEGDNGHWKVVDDVIDYDARSESPKDKNLWSEKEYKDFILRVDWRIKATPYRNKDARIVMPDGSDKLDENGKVIQLDLPDSDSGVFLRGTGKGQVNIWCWPVGSGEFYGYRTDPKMPAEVHAAVTPKMNADRNIGEWNTFEITVRGNAVTVVLNGKKVIDAAKLPGLPEKGRLALQHHGSFKDGQWQGPPSLVQFRNIYIKEL
ncbi:MAG TPA: DUF1080 domain-containing protein [Bryobacteraceae bacterium]|nr:DUF1080 domain-containing protein [Bryobacteraceae bacterium]